MRLQESINMIYVCMLNINNLLNMFIMLSFFTSWVFADGQHIMLTFCAQLQGRGFAKRMCARADT